MPFVTQEIRALLKAIGPGLSDAVGDLCCVIYTEMMRRWKESPRWTTAHYMKKEFVLEPKNSKYRFLRTIGDELTTYGKLSNPAAKFDYNDIFTAASLAWDVFFIKYIWPYELQKIQENGDIE